MLWPVNVGGTYFPITDPEVNVAGVWKPVQQGWVNDPTNTPREFYLRGFTINAINITGPGGTTGYIRGSLGSSTPSPAVFQGIGVQQVTTAGTNAGQNGTLTLVLIGAFAQNFFTNLTIGGNQYPSSQATFTGGNNWFWQVPTTPIHLLVNGQNYLVSWQ